MFVLFWAYGLDYWTIFAKNAGLCKIYANKNFVEKIIGFKLKIPQLNAVYHTAYHSYTYTWQVRAQYVCYTVFSTLLFNRSQKNDKAGDLSSDSTRSFLKEDQGKRGRRGTRSARARSARAR